MITHKKRHKDDGFSFISLLISLAIVGILGTVSIVYYNASRVNTVQVLDSESVGGRLSKTLAIDSLNNLHAMQQNFHVQHGRYATFEELQADGSIPAGYTAKLTEHGVPYLEFWDINIRADENSYLLLAVPNANAAEFDYVPILGMNETGNIWEEEGPDDFETEWLDSIDPEEEDDTDEVPFFLPDP